MSRIVNNPWSFSATANPNGFAPLRAVGDLAPQSPSPPPGGYPPGTNVLGIPGQPVTPEAIQWARRQIEKIRTAVGTGNLMFPAWLENHSDETPEIKEHYHRMVTSESTIKAAVGTKVLSVASQDVQVHPVEPTNPRHKEAADVFKLCLNQIGVGQRSVNGIGTRKIAWSVLMPALINGWSPCEAVWKDAPEWRGKGRGKLFYRDFKSKDPRRLTPLVDEFKNLVGLRTNLDAGRVFAGDLLQDIVFFSHWSLYESPLGISDMRAAYRAWWIKNTARRLQALGLDRFTGPFLVGKYAAADQRAALETALSDARSEGWLTIPVDAMVEVVNLATGTNEVFTAAIESCDKEMLMGVLGSHLQLMEGQEGNRAGDTTEHAKQGDLFTWWLGACLSDAISGQMAPSWYERNYADIEPAMVQWGGVVSVGEMVQRAGLDKQLQEMGLQLDKAEVYAYYGRSQPATPADVLMPPGQQPPPGMMGPDGQPMPPDGPGGPPGPQQAPQLGFNGDGQTYPHEQQPDVRQLGEDVRFFAEGVDPEYPRGMPRNFAEDASGHQHKGAGPGGGQFTSGGGGTAAATKHKISGAPTDEHHAMAAKFADKSPGLTPEKRAEYTEHLVHALSVLPAGIGKAVSAAINHAQGGVRFHNDLAALRTTAQQLGGNSAKGVVGFARDRGMGTEVHLDGGDDPRGTAVHELWHAADNNALHSDDKGWQTAYKKDILKGRNLLSRYAMTNASEGFAEFGRALAERGIADMEAKFPNVVKHLKSKGLI